MTKIKICGCCYQDNKHRWHQGLFILNTRTNTHTIINKKLEKVTNKVDVITCESSIGNVILSLK